MFCSSQPAPGYYNTLPWGISALLEGQQRKCRRCATTYFNLDQREGHSNFAVACAGKNPFQHSPFKVINFFVGSLLHEYLQEHPFLGTENILAFFLKILSFPESPPGRIVLWKCLYAAKPIYCGNRPSLCLHVVLVAGAQVMGMMGKIDRAGARFNASAFGTLFYWENPQILMAGPLGSPAKPENVIFCVFGIQTNCHYCHEALMPPPPKSQLQCLSCKPFCSFHTLPSVAMSGCPLFTQVGGGTRRVFLFIFVAFSSYRSVGSRTCIRCLSWPLQCFLTPSP